MEPSRLLATDGRGPSAGPESISSEPPSRTIPSLIGSVVSAMLVGALYWPTLTGLVEKWWEDPSYSHGFLVLPVSLWLAWRWWDETRAPRTPEVGLGVLETAAGITVHLAALVIGWPLLDFVSLVLVIRGVVLAISGRAWARGLMFATLFLIFMFPLPGWITVSLAVWLQDLVATVSGVVLEQLWVCQRRGHAIVFAGLDEPLIVGAECSGLRQLIALLALATLVAYLGLRTWRARLGLVLAAVPVAVLANVLRVVLMAAGAKWFGIAWMTGTLHNAPGFLVFPFALGLLALFAWALSKLERQAYRERAAGEMAHASPAGRSGGVLGTSAVLALGLVLQSAMLWHLAQAGGTPGSAMLRPLSDLPESIGGWRGGEHPQAERIRQRITFADEIAVRKLINASTGAEAHVYIVYSAQGKDREHHPEICIGAVAGLQEDVRARALVTLDEANSRPVQRFRYRSLAGDGFYVWYWHYTLEPPFQEGQTLLQAVHRRVSRRPASLTVQVTARAGPEEVAVLEQGLLKELDRVLQDEFLPPDAQMGCDRLPVRWIAAD